MNNQETYTTILADVKTELGITGTYQDNTIQGYIDEVKQFLLDGGVSETIVNSKNAKGIIARGVSDLWNYGSGGTSLSPYFIQRATQLALKSDSNVNPDPGEDDYNGLLNKPQIEGVTLVNNKELTDFGLNNLSNREIENIIGK